MNRRNALNVLGTSAGAALLPACTTGSEKPKAQSSRSPMPDTATTNAALAEAPSTGITLSDEGKGQTVLLLHGGGGPGSVALFAKLLAQSARVLVPTHPGFAQSPRLATVTSIADIAQRYLNLLQERGLTNVLVVGVSIGGWIACEMAARASSRLKGVVLVDSVGVEIPGEQVVDVFSVARSELPMLSYYRPEKFRLDPTALTAKQQADLASNFSALKFYGGAQNMQDPTLRARLAAVELPVLVLWGDTDRIVTPSYGRKLAASFPKARFELIAESGHFPQIEQPERLLALVKEAL